MLGLSTGILLTLVVYRINRKAPPPAVSKEISYITTEQYGHFDSIDSSAGFETRLYEAIEKSSASRSISLNRELSKSIINFLAAFGRGDIDAFWRFRNPAGQPAKPGRQFASFSAKMAEKRAEAESNELVDPKNLVARYWEISKNGGQVLPNVTSCVTCVTGVALDKIAIRTVADPALASKAGMTSYIRQSTRKPGATIYEGLVVFNREEQFGNQASGHYVLMYLPVALRSGAASRLHIVFHTPKEDGPYIPVLIGAEGADMSSRWLIF